MLECNYGVPGSGKSYKAVYTIYEAFINEKSSTFNKYERFYCNIAEFKFNKFEGKGFKLVPNDLIKQLSQLRLLAIQGKEESEILDKAREFNLLNSLIVWDEAQTYFSKKHDVLLWWIEYQRHLHQHVILIAQSPKRILAEYSDLGDKFFKAVPPSLRLTNSLQYKRYAESKLLKMSYIDTLTIKPSKDVFDLYTSGANEKPKKVIYKFIIIAVALFIVSIVLFKLIAGRFEHGNNDVNNSESSVVTSSSPLDLSNSFAVVCYGFSCSCMGSTFNLSDLNNYKKKFGLVPIDINSYSPEINIYSYQKNDLFFSEVLSAPVNNSSN